MKGRNKKVMESLKIISNIKRNVPERTIDNAIELADKLIKSLEIKSYPIPIVNILNDLGFSVFISDFKDKNISGFICVDPELKYEFSTDKVIAIEKSDTYGRQRFTLAHEFAHYLFDFDENKEISFFNTYDIEKSDTEEEIIPSRFAAEFLMPPKIFIKRYKELKDLTKYEKVNQLVQDFEVTLKSVSKRIEELNL